MPMIDEGEYRAKAVAYQLAFTSTGKEQAAVKFELLDFPNHYLTYFGTFASDEAFDITMRALHTAGFKGEDIGSDAWLEAAPEVMLVVYHDEYNGKTRAKIKFVNAIGSRSLNMKNALGGSESVSFAERMKGRVLKFQQDANGGQPPPPPRQANGGAKRSTASSAPAGFDEVPQDHLDDEVDGEPKGNTEDIPF